MIKFNRAAGNTSGMTACHFVSPLFANKQEFGYVRPARFVKPGERKLVYRLPATDKQWVASKTLVFLLVLVLAAFANGYPGSGLVPDQSVRHNPPASAVPGIPFHRLISISTVQGAINFHVNTIPGALS